MRRQGFKHPGHLVGVVVPITLTNKIKRAAKKSGLDFTAQLLEFAKIGSRRKTWLKKR